jgi:ATP-dependent Zn protease
MPIGKPNPRGKKLDKPGGLGPRFGSPLIYVLLLLVGFLLLRSLFQDAGFQRVPYSRLVERIKSDGCAKVVLSNDWVKCCTMQLPLEDRYLMSREELLDKMAGLMGGRAAEEIMVGTISTGASNDFKQATEIARLMVTEYGMSEALGPISLGERTRSPFLNGAQGGLGLPDKSFSERTQRRIDEEVSRLIEDAMRRARELIGSHRDALTKVAARLLATEVIEGDELRRILVENGALPPPKEGPAVEEEREGRPAT